MPDIPTVLVMDDDPGVRATMERLLRVYGYGAVTAATLEEARALLGTTAIAALILDVGLQKARAGSTCSKRFGPDPNSTMRRS